MLVAAGSLGGAFLREVFQAELGGTAEVGAARVTSRRRSSALYWCGVPGGGCSAGGAGGLVFADRGHHVLHRGVAHCPASTVGVDEATTGFFQDELVALAHGQHVAARLVRLGRDRFLGDQLRDDLFGGRPMREASRRKYSLVHNPRVSAMFTGTWSVSVTYTAR